MILLLIIVTPFLKLFNIVESGLLPECQYLSGSVSSFQGELRLMEESQKDKVCAELNKMISAQVADILLENDLYLYKVDIDKSGCDSNNFETRIVNITAGYVEDREYPYKKST